MLELRVLFDDLFVEVVERVGRVVVVLEFEFEFDGRVYVVLLFVVEERLYVDEGRVYVEFVVLREGRV